MIGLWMLTACQPYTVRLPYEEAPSPPEPVARAELSEEPIYFETLWTADGLFLQERVIEIRNRGTAPLQILAAAIRGVPGREAEAGLFSVSAPGQAVLAPGDATTLVARYRPVDLEERTAEIHVLTSDPDDPERVIPVLGAARGPRSALSGTCPAETAAGCTSRCEVSVGNTGTDVLRVDAIRIEGVDLRSAGDLPPLPWYIAPGESQALPLEFAPDEAVSFDARLHLTTNDAGDPDPILTLAPRSPGPVTAAETFAVSGGKGDLLMLLDAEKPDGSAHMDELLEHLPALLDALDATRLSWRLGITAADSGCVAGGSAWVDGTLARPQQMQALAAMITGAEAGGLAAAGMQRALLALQPWLLQPGGCNEGLRRENVGLDLIGVSPRDEASGGSPADLLSRLDALSGTVARVHALAGDVPEGCGVAVSGLRWSELADQSAGEIASICDMEASLRRIGLAAGGDRTSWPLVGAPQPATLAVEVDGLSRGRGWRWEAGQAGQAGRVVFELEEAPPFYSEVRISYVEEPVCE